MESLENMQGLDEKWAECLTIIKDNVNENCFDSFFKPIKALSFQENGTLTIQVPTEFYASYIEENYQQLLASTIKRVFGPKIKSLVYNAGSTNQNSNLSANPKRQNPQFQPYEIAAQRNIPKNPFLLPGVNIVDSRLNPSYTFANFIEGDCNKLARTAGLAVAKNAIKATYNPLLIYGKSGLGKTHLVQAIGAEIKELYPKKNVLYVDADTFERQYVNASIVEKSINDFLNFYKNIDVLIVEDVQLLASKKATQNAFFQIFNHLHQNGKQIILTTDCPPVEIEGVYDRLLTRFKWGLSAELTTPNFETRLAILRQKTNSEGISINDEMLEYIANHVTTNVRELEGVLISILAQATINKKQMNLDLAKDVVEKMVKSSQQDISIDFIKKTVCDYFNIAPEQLKSKTRKREIVQSRQIAMYFAKNYTKNSLASIGSQIGGKDHATVLHAYKTVNNLMETDKRFKRYIDDLEKRFKLQ